MGDHLGHLDSILVSNASNNSIWQVVMHRGRFEALHLEVQRGLLHVTLNLFPGPKSH